MILLRGARLVDGKSDRAGDPVDILVTGNRISDVAPRIDSPSADILDLRGCWVLPGLIDCHVHVVAGVASLAANARLPDSLVAARSATILRGMLHRGFTTVRDVGGADAGLVRAVEDGLFAGPRLVISGKALSQSGGHCDFRGPYDPFPDPMQARLGAIGRTCDGTPEVRRAAREELKGGARFIKIMANGGVASPTDPIHYLGFSTEEIRAVVEEAANAGTYVAAHLYTDAAIRRAVECGVHSLEHCNLIGADTARFAASRGAVAVPTLVVYDQIAEQGEALGMGRMAVSKVEAVRRAGLESLSIMRDAGLSMAYGTDLLGEMHAHQSEEFLLRNRVLPMHDIIASASHVAARLCGMEGQVGVIAPGAFADLVVTRRDPLTCPETLTGQGQDMRIIMKDGTLIRHAS